MNTKKRWFLNETVYTSLALIFVFAYFLSHKDIFSQIKIIYYIKNISLIAGIGACIVIIITRVFDFRGKYGKGN